MGLPRAMDEIAVRIDDRRQHYLHLSALGLEANEGLSVGIGVVSGMSAIGILCPSGGHTHEVGSVYSIFTSH
jgi:hypothetical protein